MKKSRADKNRLKRATKKGFSGNYKTNSVFLGKTNNESVKAKPVCEEVLISENNVVEMLSLRELEKKVCSDNKCLASIYAKPSNSGYSVAIEIKEKGVSSMFYLRAKRGHIRSFKTLDNAYGTLKKTGINSAYLIG